MATKNAGKGFPGCRSCINRKGDPDQCLTCEDESNWRDEVFDDEDTYEELTVAELADLINGSFE